MWRRLHLDENVSEDEPEVNFVPKRAPKLPDENECVRAVGSTRGMPRALRRAFDVTKDKHGMFSRMQAPWKDDWLAAHPDKAIGQTFDEWYAGDHVIPAGSSKSKIYLVSVGKFGSIYEPSAPKLRHLALFLKNYFYGLRVEMLPPIPLEGLYRDRGMRIDVNIRRKSVEGSLLESLYLDDVHKLMKMLVPFDAFSLIALTMHPVHNDADDDGAYFTLDDIQRGLAVKRREAVISFAPIDPWTHVVDPLIGTSEEDRRTLVMRRSCMWIAQHIMLLFGMEHCVFHSCAMNGYLHLDEMMIVPLPLCPVCLRKLHYSIGIKTTQRCCLRYSALRVFCNTQPGVFTREIAWYGKRVDTIERDRVKFEN